ncbi:MAG: methylated-DNA--[protein]-cysteine S-methyltransferase [Candidatus Izemoplasmataceae bacterium]
MGKEGYDYRKLLERLEEPFAMFKVLRDENGTIDSYALLDMNDAYASLFGFDKTEVIGRRIEDVMHTSSPPFLDRFKSLALSGGSETFKRYYAVLGKTYRFSAVSCGDGKFATLMLNLSTEETLKQKMHDLVYRDALTGLYNRRYYEETVPFFVQEHNFPLAVILFDINALKLANDAFGHETGDELIRRLSGMIGRWLKTDAWMARLGGDEFIVLIPRVTQDEVFACMESSTKDISRTHVNNIPLSFAYGVAFMDSGDDFDVVYKLAESRLYAHKLKHAASVRRHMLQLIERTLLEKVPWMRSHVDRVQNMSIQLARALEFSEDDEHKVALAARFHDIGKTAIDSRILNKRMRLTDKETLEMNRHPEIGYRIMGALNTYSEIADCILKHHENVDGSGYPLGLKQQEIPLISRILRITETYDAMVSNRPYSPAVAPHKAQARLYQRRGIEFDADLCDLFLRKVVPLDQSLSILMDSLVIRRGEKGITAIGFSDTPSREEDSSDPMVEKARRQIEEYLKGKRRTFDFPIELNGTSFQKTVYEVSRHIPYGHVWTYGDIAKTMDRPQAARAVGSALNRNPLALVVPCHRVVGANGELTGYASGIPLKKALLAHEDAL